jgi:hypothetical protein
MVLKYVVCHGLVSLPALCEKLMRFMPFRFCQFKNATIKVEIGTSAIIICLWFEVCHFVCLYTSGSTFRFSFFRMENELRYSGLG